MQTRRALIAALMAPAMPVRAVAQTPSGEILLWPKGAPGADKMAVEQTIEANDSGPRSVSGVTRPSLVVYRPSGPFSKAVLVIPGGGFRQVVVGKEGHDIARWLATNGVAAGVLTYRLTVDAWPQGPKIMLEDSQRGLRLLRQETGVAKVGVLGFSAGGTLAAILDAGAEEKAYAPIDAADALSAKPDFVGLGYAFLGKPRDPAGNGVPALAKHPAPTFLFHAADDSKVKVAGSRAAYKAIRRAGAEAELHVFKTGGHGFALVSPPGSPSAAWPPLFLHWLDRL